LRKPLNLLFDENFGPPMVRALGTLICKYREKAPKVGGGPEPEVESDGPTVQSLVELYGSGVLDEEWVPRFASGRWSVISTDRAKRCGGQKLPALLALHGVTHALVSGKLHDAGQFEKARAIFVVWEQLLELRDAPSGSRFSLRYNQDRRPTLVPFAVPTLRRKKVDNSDVNSSAA